ncbi:hypothetical protein RAG00_21140 [Klebsiella variicola subsp. variicola]|uniref:response regulator n=1 Tax=Klebsiella variicola TaxID=244366 RepID=UPI001572854B|nr:response regulator [Klebsiella variicola]EKW2093120.1 hypothetical protein [Klebsiella variicola]MDE4643206.1 hypothetical protein [Klebsiella variicola]MDE4678608.1 hypothetical protein [Klebsiella variicola]NSM79856.1 response regulator [Klebsiella variicola]NSM88674.1 response regulator [Klebsiella variicola]
MNKIDLLLVEDDEQDQKTCQHAADDFQDDNNCMINIRVCAKVEDALAALNESHFDGAIVDMRLAGDGNEGNDVIDRIKDTFRRIPVAIMTGTPDAANTAGFPLIEVYKKGEAKYSEIIDEIYKIYTTGLTKIMGGKGEIEKNLSKIFINNLLPQREKWSEYGKLDNLKTEKALLRHTLNHLIQLLDGDVDKCYPEEMYIWPPVSQKINTGGIVKDKHSNEFYIIMNPACDLAERIGGGCNTDRALLAKIDSEETFLEEELIKKKLRNPNAESLTDDQKRSALSSARQHKTFYYHWLPKTNFFKGGFINFRKISTHTQKEFDDNFDTPSYQISPPFLKDIVARFSSYYARQGQPDIEQ